MKMNDFELVPVCFDKDDELTVLTTIKDQLTIALSSIETYLAHRLGQLQQKQEAKTNISELFADLLNFIDLNIYDKERHDWAIKATHLFLQRNNKPTDEQTENFKLILLGKTINTKPNLKNKVIDLYLKNNSLAEICEKVPVNIQECKKIIYDYEIGN
jgi:hypothetical protein